MSDWSKVEFTTSGGAGAFVSANPPRPSDLARMADLATIIGGAEWAASPQDTAKVR